MSTVHFIFFIFLAQIASLYILFLVHFPINTLNFTWKGKTCLAKCFAKENFDIVPESTVLETYSTCLIVDNKPVNLSIWDTKYELWNYCVIF